MKQPEQRESRRQEFPDVPVRRASNLPTPCARKAVFSTGKAEFGDIVLRATPDGSIVRLKDVARIELGAQDYDIMGRYNGQPSAILALYQLPGSNAIETAKGVDRTS